MSENETNLHSIKGRYLEAALRGDSIEAFRIVEQEQQNGLDTLRLYQDVLAAASTEVGLMWHRGEIDIAHEHLVTQINLKLMEKLRWSFQPSQHHGVRVVVACVQGNFHSLGARVVSDFLYFDGWEVDFLGEDIPSRDLAQFVERRDAKLVALSVALEEQRPAATQAVRDLRSLDSTPYVIVGGPLVGYRPGISQEVGGDGEAIDALGAIREAHRLLIPNQKDSHLGDYLQLIGLKVQRLRKKRGWNQVRLAQASGLDRTYISAVENGKQNLTLGALAKLADGLGVSLEGLLANMNLNERNDVDPALPESLSADGHGD